MERRLTKLRKLFASLLIVGNLIFAGAYLVSCENSSQTTNPQDKHQTINEQNSENSEPSAKDPTLNEIVQYQNTVESKLDEIDNRISKLKTRAEGLSSKTKHEITKGIDELNWKKEYARKKLTELKSASADTWNDIKSEMDSTVNDLEKSYEKTISRLR